MFACEWNPNAIVALHKNLELNGVADKCQVLPGDCTHSAPQVSLAKRCVSQVACFVQEFCFALYCLAFGCQAPLLGALLGTG